VLDTKDFIHKIPKNLHTTPPSHSDLKQFKLAGSILLAEDTIDNQRLISMYIHKLGAHVDIVNNGQEAVDAALSQDYDLILMDMQMPILDGMQAVTILRDKAYSKPIAALTANAMKKDMEFCMNAGCDGFLAKPVDRNQFTELLKKYLTVVEINDATPITSNMDDEDNEFQDIIEMFVKRLPTLQQNICDAYDMQDWDRLQGLVHELKGVSGSLGFPSLMELSGTIEDELRNNFHDDIRLHMTELNALVKRIAAKTKTGEQATTKQDYNITAG
jgi:CheY-like chemotaxis protein/HPt (histidine-containing phosphotransfer) domain-containing protein